MIFDELHTAWRFYDNPDKAVQNRECCKKICSLYLSTPSTRLLPFMFRRLKSPESITSWAINDLDDNLVLDLTSVVSLIKVKTIGQYDYYYYNGDELAPMVATPPCGEIKVVVTFPTVFFTSDPAVALGEDAPGTDDTNFILQETGDYLLQEDGSKLILDK